MIKEDILHSFPGNPSLKYSVYFTHTYNKPCFGLATFQPLSDHLAIGRHFRTAQGGTTVPGKISQVLKLLPLGLQNLRHRDRMSLIA